jgi:hypothetical protein
MSPSQERRAAFASKAATGEVLGGEPSRQTPNGISSNVGSAVTDHSQTPNDQGPFAVRLVSDALRFANSSRADQKNQETDNRQGRRHVELAIEGYRSPCFDPEEAPPPAASRPPLFISLERWEGKSNVTFAVETQFDFTSVQPTA